MFKRLVLLWLRCKLDWCDSNIQEVTLQARDLHIERRLLEAKLSELSK